MRETHENKKNSCLKFIETKFRVRDKDFIKQYKKTEFQH